MQTYIALLRGINVSGQKLIKMADLRASLASLKFHDLITYIQSGNVIFSSKTTPIKDLEEKIHTKILKDFGFEIPVIVKTPDDIKYALGNNPFEKDDDNDPKLLYVVFLNEIPSVEGIERLNAFDCSPERYEIDKDLIYLYPTNGMGKSKLSNNLFENKLKVRATARNWRTTKKLLELANSIETGS